MKKRCLQAIVTLTGALFLFLFLCAMVPPSMEDLPSHLEQLNWRSEKAEIDLMHFPYVPNSFAVTSDGYWAVAYQENIHSRILLVAPEGSTKQYAFETEGNWAMDIDGQKFMIYLSRSDTYFVADLLTGQWQESCPLSTEYGDSLWELKQRRTVQQGTYRITAHEEWNSYHLELNGKTILQVSPLGIFLVRLPYTVPFLMIFLLCFAIYKNRKFLSNQAKNRNSWT